MSPPMAGDQQAPVPGQGVGGGEGILGLGQQPLFEEGLEAGRAFEEERCTVRISRRKITAPSAPASPQATAIITMNR